MKIQDSYIKQDKKQQNKRIKQNRIELIVCLKYRKNNNSNMEKIIGEKSNNRNSNMKSGKNNRITE